LTGDIVCLKIRNVQDVYPVILIHPPLSKPSEPPGGLARLAGALAARGIPFQLIDANLEGIYYLLRLPREEPSDTWTRRAVRNLERNLAFLKTWAAYENLDRYKRAVMEVNRVLAKAGSAAETTLSLADYHHRSLSPVRSKDLRHAFQHPEENPFYPYFRERIPGAVKMGKTGVAGVSLNYLSQALSGFAILGYLRQEFPAMTLVVGGGLATSWMRNSGGQNPFPDLIDHLVPGPGEGFLLSLCGVKATPGEHHLPRYDDLPLGEYLAPGPVVPYSTASGCYWNGCSFCPERAEGNPYRPNPPAKVAKDLSAIVTILRPALIHLTDNAVSPAVMKGALARVPGVPWYGFVRVTPHLADPGFVRNLRDSGCIMLKVGVESGDQGVLNSLRKGTDLSTISAALRTLKEGGISTYVYLLFGTPAETVVEARKTLDFVAGHSEYIDFLNLAIFNLPVNSPEATSLTTGDFYDGDLSLYRAFLHPRGWGRKEVREFLTETFKVHPAIQRILRRQPPLFTSNHAPFFAMSGLSGPPGMGCDKAGNQMQRARH
jgi:hypothetical protein